jgi:hypothetical protein
MRHVWNHFALGAALAVLGGLGWYPGSAPAAGQEDKPPTVGQPAPDFELPATQIGKVLPDKKDAKTLKLKDLQGKNVVLFFTLTP